MDQLDDMDIPDSPSAIAASRPALVEKFEIEELYGYRTLSVQSNHAATILIAKNGSGKTTLLGALNAFLKTEFHRLADIQFSKITCKLRGLEDALVLKKSDLASLSTVSPNSELSSTAQRFGIDPVELSDFLLSDYRHIRDDRYLDPNGGDIFSIIYSKVSYNRNEVRKLCDRLLELRRRELPRLAYVSDQVRQATKNVEIVYLPTYRRIELPLTSNKETRARDPYRKEPSIQSRLGLPRRALFSSDIYFGLSDITDRLVELNNRVQSASNLGYREISANIISELVDGTFEREGLTDSARPDKESLALFFSRLRDTDNRYRYANYNDVVLPDIDKIFNDGGSSEEVNKFLQYFLGKLNKVILATRDVEKMVEEFVTNCNAYLQEKDDQFTDEPHQNLSPADLKYLHLDKRTLQVRVRSLIRKRNVPVDALSSGEKQMISLFARLYLYEGEKIVLIDEPELSLSIDWQRKILKDILLAPSCEQVIAITHSPFVFDNELEPYAKSLDVKFKTNTEQNEEEIDE